MTRVQVAKSATVLPVEYAENLGIQALAERGDGEKQLGGLYLTPGAVARFMASLAEYTKPHLRLLDPGCGTGILSAAACEEACLRGNVKTLHLDAYEIDPFLAGVAQETLEYCRQWLEHHGVFLTFEVIREDFVGAHPLSTWQIPNHEGNGRPYASFRGHYDLIISNPPYYKAGYRERTAVSQWYRAGGHSNIYALFMELSALLLSDFGTLVCIVPRSFASGLYFRTFRRAFFEMVVPEAIHLFQSRNDVFKGQGVLQETLILAGRRRHETESEKSRLVAVSESKTVGDLANRSISLVRMESVLDLSGESQELWLPVSRADLQVTNILREWPNTLSSLGLRVSTGPVVAYRAVQFLSQLREDGENAVPLLWMHNVQPMRTAWPIAKPNRPQWISSGGEAKKLLVPDSTYVLLRRFSAKEDSRRLVAAPIVAGSMGSDRLGIENHLNYIWGDSQQLDEELAFGLAALLSSSLLDRYFRIGNGNTQVSATEMRSMPLPNEDSIRAIGREAKQTDTLSWEFDLAAVVSDTLQIPDALAAELDR